MKKQMPKKKPTGGSKRKISQVGNPKKKKIYRDLDPVLAQKTRICGFAPRTK